MEGDLILGLWRSWTYPRRTLKLIGVILAVTSLLAPPVWSAPEKILPWPTEREVVSAIRAGVKTTKGSFEGISLRSMHPVGVGNEEEAFVVSVWFPGRGRNFSAGTFLYRPKLKQAKELDYSQSLGPIYVTGHYGRFALLESYASGQGSEDFIHTLVQFVGWEVKALHQARFGNNLGACGPSPAYTRDCEQTIVRFQLLRGHANGQDIFDLVETTARAVGEDIAKGKLSVKSRRMRLVGDRFVAVKT